MPTTSTTGFIITVVPDPMHPGWVRVHVRKRWWSVAKGSASRAIVATGFYRGDMTERDVLASALREALLAYEDRLS